MNSFDDVRFPEDISYGSVGGPEFSTEVVLMQNGKEQRNINWVNDKVRYNIAPGIKNKSQLIELVAFFRARQGKARSFRFKDWLDYAVNKELLGEYKGGNKTFQLCKTYKSGNQIYKKKIVKPVKDSLVIWINNEIIKQHSLDENGVVTINSNLKGEIYASFEYDLIMRFDIDFLPISLDNFNSYEIQNIPLIEVKI